MLRRSAFKVTTFNVSPAVAEQLLAGLWYMDVHSSARPDGEIRGQLTVQTVASHRLNATGSPFSAFNVFSKAEETLPSITGVPPP